MGFYYRNIARIIIKEEIEIPKEIVHFKSLDFDNFFYTDIPLNILSVEKIKNDFIPYKKLDDVLSDIKYLMIPKFYLKY